MGKKEKLPEKKRNKKKNWGKEKKFRKNENRTR